jgi:hypothetical protein
MSNTSCSSTSAWPELFCFMTDQALSSLCSPWCHLTPAWRSELRASANSTHQACMSASPLDKACRHTQAAQGSMT